MNADTDPARSSEKRPLQIQSEPVQEIYCEHCQFFTPAWRDRCIHCSKRLPRERCGVLNTRPATGLGEALVSVVMTILLAAVGLGVFVASAIATVVVASIRW